MLTIYILFAIIALFISPLWSLVLGILTAIILGNPFKSTTSRISKILLQVSVVAMGFGINLLDSMQSGIQGVAVTAFTVVAVISLGLFVGRLLGLERKGSYLISVGTAICGGSAIAAVAPVIDSDEDTTSISLSTIFLLNALALIIFPPIGRFLNLSQEQFGMWAAIAIHDTSSVVGAASIYGDQALALATMVKLTRALWIIPVSLVSVLLFKSGNGAKVKIPYFILLFIVAAAINTTVSIPEGLLFWVDRAARAMLSVTLFLIGTSLSIDSIRRVGLRPIVLGSILWVIISITSVWVIMTC